MKHDRTLTKAKLEGLASTVGAGILGFGLGALLSNYIQQYAFGIILIGLLLVLLDNNYQLNRLCISKIIITRNNGPSYVFMYVIKANGKKEEFNPEKIKSSGPDIIKRFSSAGYMLVKDRKIRKLVEEAERICC